MDFVLISLSELIDYIKYSTIVTAEIPCKTVFNLFYDYISMYVLKFQVFA